MEKNRNGYPVSDPRRSTGNTDGEARGGALGFRGGCAAENGQNSSDSTRGYNNIGARGGCGMSDGSASDGACDEVKLAYVYAPNQKFCMLYSAEEALKHGTLFENLYKPMEVYGRE